MRNGRYGKLEIRGVSFDVPCACLYSIRLAVGELQDDLMCLVRALVGERL